MRGNFPVRPGASQTRSEWLKEADSNQLVSGSLLRYWPRGSFSSPVRVFILLLGVLRTEGVLTGPQSGDNEL